MASTVEISLPNGLKYKQPTGLFIDNKFVDATGDDFTVYNPACVTHLCFSIIADEDKEPTRKLSPSRAPRKRTSTKL